MCGRYTVAVDPQLLAERFGVTLPEDIEPRFNVAPTDPVLALTERSAGRELMVARWGLVPHWAKDAKGGARMINARAETLAEKPAYRPLLAKNRCLILADGFYEWRLDPDGKKRPGALRARRRLAVRLRGPVDELARSRERRVAALLHDHHDDGERHRGARPRPHAGDPPARRRGGVARPRRPGRTRRWRCSSPTRPST